MVPGSYNPTLNILFEMTKTQAGVIVTNFSFLNEKKNSTEKLNKNFSSNESLSSENSVNESSQSSKWTSKSNLPLKKRYGGLFEDSNINNNKKGDNFRNPWIQMQQTIASKNSETKQSVLKPEAKKASILPGVIRHTSCPDNTLAY